VEAVEHGAAAIDLYMSRAQEGRPFDAVLLDLTVPGGMGGLDAARALLRLDPSAKCIASSGYSADSTMARPGECFVAVLPKPYSRAALAQVMNGILVRPR
jgi:CheY-like chemotaxis protein